MDVRVLLIAVLATTALAGLAMAAEDQAESFLHPTHLENGLRSNDQVSGNLVALTGLLVGLAATLGAMLLSNVGWKRRVLPLFVVFVCTYGGVLLLQTAMFAYVAEDQSRSAIFAISPIVMNEHATPSTFLGPLALLALMGLGLQQAGRRLQDRPRDPSLADRYREWLGALMLATPFLGIVLFGNIRFLLSIPADETGTLPYLVILPVLGLAGLGLLIVYSVKTWHLSNAVRDPHLRVVAEEAWGGLRRAEWAVTAVIVIITMLATLFEGMRSPAVETTAFNLNARTHTQAQIALLFVVMPLISAHRSIVSSMHSADPAERSLGGLLGYWGLGGAGLVLAGVLTFTTGGALWPWLALTLPLSILAIIVLPPRAVLLPTLLGAVVLWGIGNTVIGSFQLNEEAELIFTTPPALLAMWRAMAVTLVAIAVARNARGAHGLPKVAAWPLTAGLGAAVAIIVFFEFPFSAWIVHEFSAEYVGIGTVVASQDASVRGVMHTIAALAALAGGIIGARLHRPDWFRKEPTPMPDVHGAEG